MSTAVLGQLESGVEIEIPAAEPGIGKVILSPTSSELIAGVEIRALSRVAGRSRAISSR